MMEQSDKEFLNSKTTFDPMPSFESGIWREQIPPSSLSAVPRTSLTDFVSGSNRCKYFNQPLKQSQTVKRPCSPNIPDWWWSLQEPEPPTFVTSGTQTDYRESETQTDPWDPPCRVKRIHGDPELLTLSKLQYGKGLPASSLEVEEISRARAKKQWEPTLPPFTSNEKELKKRHQMIVDQKIEEWSYKTSKMKEKQAMKHKLMEYDMAEQICGREERKGKLLEHIWANKKAEMAEKASKLRTKLSKSIKMFENKHTIFSQRNTERNVFDQKSSTPTLNQNGKTKGQMNSMSGDYYLSTAKGLVELELWLWEEQNMAMEAEIYLPKKEARPSRLEKIIEQAQKDIKESKTERTPAVTIDKSFQVERTKLRPPTPSVSAVSHDTLDRNYSAVFLQKTLRGRALQKEVMEIKNKYINLIRELHTTHFVFEEEEATMKQHEKELLAHYRKLKKSDDKNKTRNEVLSRFEGETVSGALNLLGKSAPRFQETTKVESVVSRAKEERRQREAEEAGRRQQESLTRQILEEISSQIHYDQQAIIKEFVNHSTPHAGRD